MPQSFTAAPSGPLATQSSPPNRAVLVTGAAGNIGSYFAEQAHRKHRLRLMVRPGDKPGKVDPLRHFGDVVTGELGDIEHLKHLCDSIDTVLHLAADSSPSATWSSLLENNISGAYHMAVAAKAAGCRRLVYASSIHAVSGYPADVQVKTTDPVNPGDLYGVSKCFAEALCRYMAEKEGLSCIAVRIGAVRPIESARAEGSIDMLDAFVSQRDLQQLLEKCIDVDELRFALFHGLSDNRFKRLDISDARQLLGYAPVDDLTDLNPKLRALKLAERVQSHSQDDARQKSGIREEIDALKGDPEKGAPTKAPQAR